MTRQYRYSNYRTNTNSRLGSLGSAYVVALYSFILAASCYYCHAGTPAEPLFWTNQLLDHHAAPEDETPRWTQRYYVWDTHFAGPGSPIFVILGGEGAIEPSTGLLYPFVTHHLAPHFQAFVLQPEHRFYGASQPLLNTTNKKIYRNKEPDPRFTLLTYDQALLDAMLLIQATRDRLGCSHSRVSKEYCPVITVGGSYPGFLSAMARIIHPDVVDMAYAASAPMLLYAQTVPQEAYYQRITQVAETAVPGCAHAVQSTLSDVKRIFHTSSAGVIPDFGACPESIPAYCSNQVDLMLEEVMMMVAYTFANDNMAFYPPVRPSHLHTACDTFMQTNTSSLNRMKSFLVSSLGNKDRDCFDMDGQLPAGPRASISGGDWSGIGTGVSGDSWDFQACTLCVEAIGFNSSVSMFLDRPWSLEWLSDHCQARFGVVPQPDRLRKRWHLDDLRETGATRILFTNGLNDGWSVSGIVNDLSDTLRAINFPNGAHHSDLSGRGPSIEDTDDVRQGYVQIQNILTEWLDSIRVVRSGTRVVSLQPLYDTEVN